MITMAALVAALGAAVYLNWQYAGAEDPLSFEAQDSMVLSAEGDAISDVNKNYGDAQLVSLSKNAGDAYFDEVIYPYEDDGVGFWWIDWQQGTKAGKSDIDPLFLLNHY